MPIFALLAAFAIGLILLLVAIPMHVVWICLMAGLLCVALHLLMGAGPVSTWRRVPPAA